MEIVENNRKTISARFNGRIEIICRLRPEIILRRDNLYLKSTARIWFRRQNDYIIALNNSFDSSPLAYVHQERNGNIWTDAKIKLRIGKVVRRHASITLYLLFTYSGTVIEKKVQEECMLMKSTAIYDVAELSSTLEYFPKCMKKIWEI